jgi:hypothetical protein
MDVSQDTRRSPSPSARLVKRSCTGVDDDESKTADNAFNDVSNDVAAFCRAVHEEHLFTGGYSPINVPLHLGPAIRLAIERHFPLNPLYQDHRDTRIILEQHAGLANLVCLIFKNGDPKGILHYRLSALTKHTTIEELTFNV